MEESSSPSSHYFSIFTNYPLLSAVLAFTIAQFIKFFTTWSNGEFLVSIAYIDPGNFETDLQSGAQYKYELLWIILVASCAALVIQSLAANLGVVTGKHLAEHCRAEYSKVPNFMLWVVAEIAVVALIGTAFALNMLFNIPVWIGVLLTGFSTLILLALQKYGIRKLEFLIAFLVLTIAVCFLIELHYSKPDPKEVLYGLFVPQLKGNGATGLAISLLGAMVMPHNLFLHSALVLSRKIPRSVTGIKEACRYYMIESGLALTVAFLINVSVISVSGAVCNASDLSPEDQASCEDLDLNKASFLLRNVVGKWSSKLFAIALLASGQSSTITGTYAGQYVMQGFLNLTIRPWLRNFLTRCLAIIPRLIVALIGGSAGAGKLIIIASMVLSFELPFALVPLLKFTCSKTKMGSHANSLLDTMCLYKEKRWDLKRLVGSGGMPSSHSATVTALAMAVGLQEGFGGSLFAMAFILTSIGMYDATGVRLHAGRQAGVLNQIVYELPSEHPLAESRPLRELLGHTPPQVIVGGILGTATAVVGYLVNLTAK
uniref:Uncharacterized protein n=1 Tax=Brassica campestris TaxID=3711 RepID=M4EYU6_BRACM